MIAGNRMKWQVENKSKSPEDCTVYYSQGSHWIVGCGPTDFYFCLVT